MAKLFGREWEIEQLLPLRIGPITAEEKRDRRIAYADILAQAEYGLSGMRRARDIGDIDEEQYRDLERQVVVSPKVRAAFKEFGIDVADAFVVDEEERSPRFVGWPYVPAKELKEAQDRMQIKQMPQEAATRGAQLGMQEEAAGYGRELFGAKRRELARGGIAGETLMGLRGPEVPTSTQMFREEQLAETKRATAERERVTRGREAREEKRATAAMGYLDVQKQYLEWKMEQEQQGTIDPELNVFIDNVRQGYKYTIGQTVPMDKTMANDIMATFASSGLARRGYHIHMVPVKDPQTLWWGGIDIGEADYMRIVILPAEIPFPEETKEKKKEKKGKLTTADEWLLGGTAR